MNDDRPVKELEQLIGKPSADFRVRLHRRIERRVLTRDLSVMWWEMPKVILIEFVYVCSTWLSSRKSEPGGRS